MQSKDQSKNNHQQYMTVPGSTPIEADISFNPALLDTKDINMAISLLQAEEESVLLIAVEALSNYASKSKANTEKLYELNILTSILPIIEHEDLFIRRFAAKLLAEMVTIPDVMTYLIEFNYISYFVNLLTNEKDIFMQEYFSAILAKLSRDAYAAALLVNACPNMDVFFEMVQSTDPDLKRNNFEILYNSLQDIAGARKILETKGFNFYLLYEHCESPYLEIQYLALDIIVDIIARNKDEHAQSLFRETNGIKVLLDFLKSNECINLHIKALKTLCFATEITVNVEEFINAGGILQIFNYAKYVEEHNLDLFMWAFKIIVHTASIPNGRQILYSHEAVEYLIDLLERFTQFEIIEVICFGIGNMALYDPAIIKFTDKESIKTILEFIKIEELQTSAKYAAIFSVKQLLMNDVRNYQIFSDMNGQDYILQLLKKFVQEISIELCTIAFEVLIIIARHPTFKYILINSDTFDGISIFLDSSYPFIDKLKITCCDILSVLCLEEEGREYFVKMNMPLRLYNLINNSPSIAVRNAIIHFVQMISVNLIIAKLFVENQFLLYMLNNRKFSRIILSWDSCIETLFKSHLPMKFAFTGRLSHNDIIQDGFYVLRRSVRPFPTLDNIWELESYPPGLIYVVNSIKSSVLSALKNDETFEDATYESDFEDLQCDPHFIEYLEYFKCMISAAESKDTATDSEVDVSYVSSRARMLGRFVARQMCGFDPEIECLDYQLEVHLKELQKQFTMGIIPLGQLRVGSYFERALLFKAMADRLCLPSTLVRGEYGISWVEISIPEMNDGSPKILDDNAKNLETTGNVSPELLNESDVSEYNDEYKMEKMPLKNQFPVKLIKPDFIVDLMDTPGDLIPIGSHRAKLYCTKTLMCDKMCYH